MDKPRKRASQICFFQDQEKNVFVRDLSDFFKQSCFIYFEPNFTVVFYVPERDQFQVIEFPTV